MNTKYRFFKWLKGHCDKQMQVNFLKPKGGCNSACPNCKEWEHQGNTITTELNSDDTGKRACGKCGYQWVCIFTPAGFIPISECKPVDK